MPKERNRVPFDSFGEDVKSAREVLGLSRKALAEIINIDPRYLANIENSGSLPSLPIFHELVSLCCLPVEKYFYPGADEQESEEQKRVNLKLRLCPEKDLPIVESTIDGAIKLYEAEQK
jgi:transcriptional regulator with XRE-family HTH domain